MSDKRIRIRKRALILMAISVLAVLSVTGVFAWFTGSVEGIGTSVKTGRIALDFDSYKYEASDPGDPDNFSLNHYIDKSISGTAVSIDSIELASELQRSISVINGTNDVDTVYFVVKKAKNSVPLDVQLELELAGLFSEQVSAIQQGQSEDMNLEYAGGFWYNLKDITAAVAETSVGASASVEDRLEAYAENTQSALSSQLPNDQCHSVLRMNSITKDNTSTALQNGDYCVFRLTIGLDRNASGAVQYQDQKFDVNVTLTAAQQGGLDTIFGTSDIYYVSNVDELEYFMSVYKPGDSLVITKSFTYVGDLVFPRPVNMTLNNNGAGTTLTVSGNLIFSYPYTDGYSVNTTGGGRIIVRKFQNAGGNFNIDIPNSSVSFLGTNNTAQGKADIYVEGDFTVNANCVPDRNLGKESTDLDAGCGIILNRTRIMDGNGEDQNQNLERIYLHDATMLTITASTKVGEVYIGSRESDVNVKQAVISNHGTVTKGIFMANMDLSDAAAAEFNSRHIPQIYISNYGTIETSATSAITLPANSTPFNWGSFTGNTWITRELGAADGGVTGSSGYGNDDIFARYVDTYVVDVDGDGRNLRVFYTSFSNDAEGAAFNLSQIINERYLNNPEVNKNTESVADIEKLTVSTGNGKVLLAEDYTFIRTMTNLKVLDLSSANTQQNSITDSTAVIPANAFKNMSELEHVDLPSNATTLKSSAFLGTKVYDLYLPAKMTTVEKNGLAGVKYVHPLKDDAVITGLRTGDSGIDTYASTRYLFVPANLRANYRTSYSGAVTYIFSEATLSEDQNYFYRITSGQTAQIATWVGTPFQTPGSEMAHFDFCSLHLGDDLYKITAYDDYAFCNKAKANPESDTKLTVEFSDQLFEIGTSAFENGSGIGSVTFNQNSVRDCEILSNAFLRCSSIPGLELWHVTSVGTNAFAYCTGLKTVYGESVTAAYYQAFANCDELLAVRLPSVTKSSSNSNNSNLFYNCPKLMAAEIGIISSSGLLYNPFQNDKNLVFVNVDARQFAGSGIINNFYTTAGTASGYYSMFVDSVTLASDNSTFLSKVTSNDHYVDIKNADPREFIYYTRNDSTEVPRMVSSGGRNVTLSDITCGGVTYGDYVFAPNADGQSAALISCFLKEINGEYAIPGQITAGGKTYTVTSIGNKAYYYTDFVNARVTVPASITSIGNSAFYNKDGIVELNILSDACTLGTSCFQNCDGITSLDLNGCTELGGYCFKDCSSVRTIVGEKVSYAGYQAFCNCAELIAVRLPSLTKTTGSANNCYLFSECPKLMAAETGLISASGVIYNPFNNDKNLILLNTYTRQFAGYAIDAGFYNSFGTSSAYYRITVDSVTRASDTATFLSKITNGHTLDTGNYAPEDFIYYTRNDVSEVPYTVTSGGSEITLSDIECGSVTYGDYVFAVDNGGDTVTLISCLLKEIRGEYTVPGSITAGGKTYTVKGIGNKAYYYTDFTNVKLTVPASIASIGNNAFYNKDGIVELTILSDACTLGTSCFQNCDGLTSLDLGGCTELGWYCFKECSSIKTVVGEKVSYAGYQAFYNCAELLAVRLPSLTQTAGSSNNSYLFADCPKLMVAETGLISGSGAIYYPFNNDKNLVLLNTYTRQFAGYGIDAGFYNWFGTSSAYHRITVDSVTKASDTATFLSKITNGHTLGTESYAPEDFIYYTRNDISEVPYTVTGDGSDITLSDITCGSVTYGDYVFAVDSGSDTVTLISCLLKEIKGEYTVPGSIIVDGKTYTVKGIGNKAFYYTDFTDSDVTVPVTIVSIGSYAFNNRDGIKSITILGEDCTLGASCFYDCDGLTFLDLRDCASLGVSCFSDCSALEFVVGENVSTANYRAFNNCANLIAVRLPKLSVTTSSGNDNHLFRDCPKLMILDVGFITSGGNCYYSLSGNSSLVLLNVHTETHPNDAAQANFFNSCSTSSSYYRLFIDSTSALASTETTLESKITNGHKATTGNLNAGTFFYYSRDDASETRYTVANDYDEYILGDITLGDITYGDYVLAPNSSGNTVTLIGCLLREIRGEYTVPGNVTVDGETYTVTAISNKAFYYTTFTDAVVNVPETIVSIGDEVFYNRDGIKDVNILGDGCTLGDSCFYDCDGLTVLNLQNCSVLGTSCFSDCSALEFVVGGNVSKANYRAFNNCANLIGARLPKLSVTTSSGNDNHLFKDCTKLMVLDAGFITSGGNCYYSLTGNKNLVLLNVHTETHSNDTAQANFYNSCSSSSGDYRILIDGVSVKTDSTTTLASTITNGRKINTGNFNAGSFFYYSRESAGETRYKVTNDYGTYYLDDIVCGDMTYGDYVFAVNDESAHTATLVSCLLKSIGGSYRVPETVEHNGITYTVNSINQYAYKFVAFESGTSVILPSVMASIGESAFAGASNITQIVIENNSDYIAAANILGGSINAGLKVMVSEEAYNNIYTAAATPWGGIARSRFVSTGYEFQPVAGGPIFHVDNYNGGLQLVFITNVADDVTTVTVPDGDGGRNMIAIGENAFSYLGDSNVATMVLPEGLQEFNADMSLAPVGFAGFVISETAPYFSTADGMLLSKDGSMLIRMPRLAAASDMTMPEGIKVVAGGAFTSVSNLVSLTIPETSSVMIADNAFVGCGSLNSVTFQGEDASWFTGRETFRDCNATLEIFVPAANADLYISNAPMDAAVRSMMTAYEYSFAEAHECTFGEFVWYVSFDGTEGMGTEAIACRECSECHEKEHYHTTVDGEGYAMIDIDEDGTPESDITFFPFADPAPLTMTAMAMPESVSAEGPDGTEPGAEGEEGIEGSSGSDGNGDEGESGSSEDGSEGVEDEPAAEPEQPAAEIEQPEPETPAEITEENPESIE